MFKKERPKVTYTMAQRLWNREEMERVNPFKEQEAINAKNGKMCFRLIAGGFILAFIIVLVSKLFE